MHSDLQPPETYVSSDLQVKILTSDDESRWDDFVFRHIHGSAFHLIAWQKSIEETFGHRPYYLLATRGEEIEALLPLFLVNNFILGKVLMSSPFAVYGGVLANTDEAHEAIRQKVISLAKTLGVQYVELRNGYPEQRLGFSLIDRYVTFTRAATTDGSAILASLEASTRNKIRKSLKHPVESRDAADLGPFFELLAITYRRLGTPFFPRKHFEALQRNFGKMLQIREVAVNGKVIAASLNFLFRDECHNFNSGSDLTYKAMAPNNYMYFDLIQWAGQHGCRTFDFGRSKVGSGPYEFKKYWGTTIRELPYEILLVKRKELPNFSPANSKFQFAIKVWQKLPLWLTKVAGPYLIRFFP